MLLYAGIDEAGYGPMFGPLCVGATVFAVEDHDPAEGPPDLWRRLRKIVCRSRRDAPKRIAVDDSKLLKGPRDGRAHPLTHLERGVLAFEAARSAMPSTDADLLRLLGAAMPAHPWYGGASDLPVAGGRDRLGIDASRLRREMARAGIAMHAIRCTAIDVESFNREVGIAGSKATVNLDAALRLLDGVWRSWPEAHPRVIIDRHGGRTHYREDLQQAWPDARLRIVAETEQFSRYRLDRDGSLLTVSFVRESESRHLPVALASMTAKYVRELLMLRLNRFFRGHLPELKPTAGYVQDGRRYLREIGPLIERLGVPRSSLVRRV